MIWAIILALATGFGVWDTTRRFEGETRRWFLFGDAAYAVGLALFWHYVCGVWA